MGNNNLLFGVIGIGGLLYFYNQNPDFKAKIDSFIQSLHGGQTAAAAPTTTTVNNYYTCDANGKNCTSCDPNTQNCVKTDNIDDTQSGLLDSNLTGQTLVNHAAICKSKYGGNCSGECKGGADQNCLDCQKECGSVNLSTIGRVSKKKKPHVVKSTKGQTKDLVSTNPVKTGSGCAAACDTFKGTSEIYKQCCDTHAAYARRFSYYSVGSLYTPVQNCPSQCWPWKNLNPSVYQACCHNHRRRSRNFHLL